MPTITTHKVTIPYEPGSGALNLTFASGVVQVDWGDLANVNVWQTQLDAEFGFPTTSVLLLTDVDDAWLVALIAYQGSLEGSPPAVPDPWDLGGSPTSLGSVDTISVSEDTPGVADNPGSPAIVTITPSGPDDTTTTDNGGSATLDGDGTSIIACTPPSGYTESAGGVGFASVTYTANTPGSASVGKASGDGTVVMDDAGTDPVPGTQETQTITLPNLPGTKWTPSAGVLIDFGASAATVEARIEAELSTLVTVVKNSDTSYTVIWAAVGDQSMLPCDGNGMRMVPTAEDVTPGDGGGGVVISRGRAIGGVYA